MPKIWHYQAVGEIRFDIVRTRYNDRVYHWQRRDPSWPGHIAYIALRVDEVQVGDRYREEACECVFACTFREFLDGCFHDSIRDVFGAATLEEALAEVRAEVGPEPAAPVVESAAPEKRPEKESGIESRRVEQPAAGLDKSAAIAAGKGTVDVVITRCERVDLTLATALRSVTRVPVRTLLDGLRQLPYIVANDVTVSDGLAVSERLSGLGAKIEMR